MIQSVNPNFYPQTQQVKKKEDVNVNPMQIKDEFAPQVGSNNSKTESGDQFVVANPDYKSNPSLWDRILGKNSADEPVRCSSGCGTA